MKPEVRRFLDVSAGHLMMKTAPALGAGYEQGSIQLLAMLLLEVSQEFEQAAKRRVEENAVLRGIFADAAPVVSDIALRERLEQAARGQDTSLAVSDLEADNVKLRELLIALHVHVEELEGADARRIDEQIWSELFASTERRRRMLGAF